MRPNETKPDQIKYDQTFDEIDRCTDPILYLHTYICIYICIYVYMYVCIYVYMYICIYVYMYICIYVSMYLCMYVYMYICMYMYVYVYIYICLSHRSTYHSVSFYHHLPFYVKRPWHLFHHLHVYQLTHGSQTFNVLSCTRLNPTTLQSLGIKSHVSCLVYCVCFFSKPNVYWCLVVKLNFFVDQTRFWRVLLWCFRWAAHLQTWRCKMSLDLHGGPPSYEGNRRSCKGPTIWPK